MLEPISKISAIVYHPGEIKIDIHGLSDPQAQIPRCFNILENERVFVDMINLNTDKDGKGSLSFTVPEKYAPSIFERLAKEKEQLLFERIDQKGPYGKISVVGTGIHYHTDIPAKIFSTLHEKNIPYDLIATSELKISVLVPQDYIVVATRSLHAAFDLS